MFGDFWQQFGLQFPFFGIDQQGGLSAAFQSPDPNTQQQPGMENKSPSPPGPQAAAAPQPKPSPGGSPLASPLAPFSPAGMRRSGNVEDARGGSPTANLRSLYGPGSEVTLEGQLYGRKENPEGLQRRGSFGLDQGF